MPESLTTASNNAAVPDPICAQAVDLARRAITETLDDVAAGTGVHADQVGDHRGVTAEIADSATHRFAAHVSGYVGWEWVVTLVRAPQDSSPSVADVVLLPGEGALVAPAWVPWQERIAPGDLGPGDLLPSTPDDVRLVPGYTGEGDLEDTTDADAIREAVWELGLGRTRVLSPEGRADAFERWYDGETGPTAPMAQQAPETCSSCGFLLPIGGRAGQVFGVCANLMSPADGRIVALDYGCGAHSEVQVTPAPPVDVVSLVIDEIAFDTIDVERTPATHAGAVADDVIVTAETSSDGAVSEPDAATTATTDDEQTEDAEPSA